MAVERYRPLGGPQPWAAAPVDATAWQRASAALGAARAQNPVWATMVGRGVLLAAAHQSGASSSRHGGDRHVALALLTGAAAVADLDAEARRHVLANFAALRLAADQPVVDEGWLRRVHAVACGPQHYHAVVSSHHGEADHALAHGDYKHHPNDDDARRYVPVDGIGDEMRRLVDALGGEAFMALHPVTRAAYGLHALDHIRPFAAGNGRVARALASTYLLESIGIPLVVWTTDSLAADSGDPSILVAELQRLCLDVVQLVTSKATTTGPAVAALDRWRRRGDAAAWVGSILATAVEAALDRHRLRPPVTWQSDLTGTVVTSTDDHLSVTVRAPARHGPGVDERLDVDAHPVAAAAGVVTVWAERAGVGQDLDSCDLPRPAPRLWLDPWLDQVVRALAVRAAAAVEVDDD